ncbi:MAG: hypothetical protein HYX32_06070 [Actinobacteria bacterium]|nr:hypothetical protein [Actinomycetota bacterium]
MKARVRHPSCCAALLVVVALAAAACAGTEAAPNHLAALATTATGPSDTGPGTTQPGEAGTTMVPGTADPATIEPETTTTAKPRLPSAPTDENGTLTEANPAAAGNPSRDVGISVRLSDGRYLWVFGDTMYNGQTLSNTAGIAAAGSTAIYDEVDGNRRLTQFIPYNDEELAYNRAHAGDGSRWVLWPNAAVPLNGGTQVLIFFERSITNMQPGGGSTTGPTGKPVIGTAVWDVAGGANGPIQARRVNDTTFYGANLNTAYLDASGSTVWLLSCVTNGRCLTAQVPADKATDGTAWRWWTGTGFTPDVRAGIPLPFPDPESVYLKRTYPDGAPFAAAPWAGGNIVYDPVRRLYLLAFTSWPGYADAGYLRTSPSPTGPWSPPIRFYLPGCDAADCYAVSVHPDLSRGPTTIGISYHLGSYNRTALVNISGQLGR